MNKQQYLAELLSDGQDWIDENIEYYDSFGEAYDDMELVITGNDNGSYYCSSYKAEQALEGVMWDEEIADLCRDFGFDGIPTEKGPEACDVIVRCALLCYIYGDLEEYWDDNKEEEGDEENLSD